MLQRPAIFLQHSISARVMEEFGRQANRGEAIREHQATIAMTRARMNQEYARMHSWANKPRTSSLA